MKFIINKKINNIRSSVYFLIAANMVPLFGVLFLKWDIINILFLYWMESGVIGFYNVLKILTAENRGNYIHDIFFKIFAFIFFNIHYPIMLAVLMAAGINLIATLVFNRPLKPFDVLSQTWITLVSFLISHGYSFVKNYLQGGERKSARVIILLFQPYLRIAVMWFVLMGGTFFILKYQQAVFLIVILVVLKIIFDCISHYRERKKFSRN